MDLIRLRCEGISVYRRPDFGIILNTIILP